MKKKVKRKKGASLIEVIVSITVLAIVIIPISNLIINAVKTNKMSERKQLASFEGQTVLEEFKSYDSIVITDGEFSLLDGNKMAVEEDEPDSYSGKVLFTKGNQNFELNVTMKKDNQFKNNYVDTKYCATFSLLSNDKKVTYKLGETGVPEEETFSGDTLIFEIGSDEKSISLIEVNSGVETLIKTYTGIDELVTKKFLVDISSEYIQPIEIKGRNMVTDKTKYFDTIIKQSKNERTRGPIKASSLEGEGDVINKKTIQGLTGQTIGDLYNIEVEVKYNDEVYYKSSVAQNIEVIN